MHEKSKIKIPGIGMRIVKSAVAVALCMVVNEFRGSDGIVFYSQLAALWCIQMYRNNTISNAYQRIVGTVIGAIYGLIYILLYPSVISRTEGLFFVGIIALFISIVLVIYTTVLVNKKQASYFSCVVYLSIIINHIGDANPYLFVWNRFLDTVIGICIGILVNNARICIHPDRKTLFVSGADDILLDKNNHINDFSKVELNRMIEDGMRFTISTKRTPASLLESLSDIRLKYPVIVMDGAALYDTNKNEYIRNYVISEETSAEMWALLSRSGLCVYANVIIDDTLLIYYRDMKDDINNEMVKKLKTSPYRNYIKRDVPESEKVVYFMMLDHTDKIDTFYDKLLNEGYGDRLKIVKYPSDDYKGYSYIKIYNKNATKENMLLYLTESYGISDTVTFGTIEGKYDILVPDNDFNAMVRIVRKKYERFFI